MKDEYRSVNIDLELWKKAEIFSVDKGIRVNDVIEEAISEKINREKAQIQT